MQPFAGTVFAVLMLRSGITALTFVGGGILAAGIALSRLRRSPPVAVVPARALEDPELALAVVPPHE